ncbi:hypothetical protein CVT24_005152 [Panaeolus cyanescens]|uniref:Amidohydrolase-related domain-containing protein n=1 Tax=Panaeolus cyanescens TaxID=181874 RepID=A0A409VD62_9AGAR|nr:hypothetical protein CVT24_005152 [Panaeolus cyanescens]
MDKDTFGDVRMDTVWSMRQAYNIAGQIKKRQDEFCDAALSGRWNALGDFPEVLQWESLVDVLRGRVKLNVHCYSAMDIDAMIRLSNEFKFEIAGFHHASEAYLIPERIKAAYGNPPALALFASAGRYKLEAYRSSEFAPKVLARHGLKVVMKSDHPFINSRYLLYEAQQAFFYGLPPNLAIASVTTAPAEMLGMDHRIGYIKEDSSQAADDDSIFIIDSLPLTDLVIWDSHPLALGATPTQVLIDGIPQIPPGIVVEKPSNFQRTPKVPNFGDDAEKAVQYDGLPPLEPSQPEWTGYTWFTNVSTIYQTVNGAIQSTHVEAPGNAIFRGGSAVCLGECSGFSNKAPGELVKLVDLEGGSITPGLVSFGSQLGLNTIEQEPSTNDGPVLDPLEKQMPDILGGDTFIPRAVDGVLFGTRDAFLAYRAGVTYGITAPSHDAFFIGLATALRLGSHSRLQRGSIVQEVTAVHVSIGRFPGYSVSTQIAALRRMLHNSGGGEAGHWFSQVRQGIIPLVVETHEADIIATLIILKKEIDVDAQSKIRMTIAGGAEAHLLARELAEAEIGVILNPPRPFPYSWESRRILPGPPITNNTAVTELLAHNVLVGLGCEHVWDARNLPFEVTRVAIDSGNRLSKEQALALGTTNMRRLLGLDISDHDLDLVATRGGDLLNQGSRVVAIISAQRKMVEFLSG